MLEVLHRLEIRQFHNIYKWVKISPSSQFYVIELDLKFTS